MIFIQLHAADITIIGISTIIGEARATSNSIVGTIILDSLGNASNVVLKLVQKLI